ncbi:MAG: hypothetical protein V4671_28640 [Armatimonadota bacterium]
MQTTEERLAALEQEMAAVKQQLNRERAGVIGRTRPDFLQNYTRRSTNSPLFDEVAQAIQAEREKEREAAQSDAGESESSS